MLNLFCGFSVPEATNRLRQRTEQPTIISMEKEVQNLVKSLNKKFGSSTVVGLGEPDTLTPADNVIPTGVPLLDNALGVGGLPRGRLVELYGPESSGKSTLALAIVAELHRRTENGLVLYVDAEHSLGADYCRAVGVDPNRLILHQPMSGEEAFNVARDATDTGQLDMVVFDSIAAMIPKAELEGEMEDHHMGARARMVGKGVNQLIGKAAQNNTLILCINQIRMKLGGYGNPETTPGGKALKFGATVRLEVRSPASMRIKEGKVPVGQRCRVIVKKNKAAPPGREAHFTIRYGHGVDNTLSLVEAAVEAGVWEKRGSWYKVPGGASLAQGEEAVCALLRENPDTAEQVRSDVAAVFRGDTPTGFEFDPNN